MDTAPTPSAAGLSPSSLASLASLLSGARVLVVGDIMLDRYWFGEVERISPEAPVPVVQVIRSDDRLGGAANVARNVSALGACASLSGVVGDDEAGQRIRRLLADAGITDLLQVRGACPTIVKLRVLGRQQQLLRIDFDPACGANPWAGASSPGLSVLADHDVLVISDYAKGALQELPPLIGAARAAGLPVLVDPKGADYQRYRGASLLTPNKAELRQVIGAWFDEPDLASRAQRLRSELRAGALLLTRSEEGMSLFDDSGVRHFPARAREVFDVCGAGDTVIAVIAATMAAGMPLVQSVALANHAAGLAVGKLGTAVVRFDELFD